MACSVCQFQFVITGVAIQAAKTSLSFLATTYSHARNYCMSSIPSKPWRTAQAHVQSADFASASLSPPKVRRLLGGQPGFPSKCRVVKSFDNCGYAFYYPQFRY